MKRIDFFCASQASTAICLSMQDQPSSSTSSCSSSAAIQLGGRAIDRHNPIITRDSRRFTTVPCSSQTPPINPVPYHQLQKTKKSSNNSDHHQQTKKNDQKKKKKKNPNDIATSTITNKKIITTSTSTSADSIYKNTFTSSVPADIKRKSSVKPGGDLITPPGSTRYLLGDGAYFDGFSDYNDPVFALVPGQTNKNITNPADLVLDQQHQSTTASKSSLSSLSPPLEKPSSNQVVVLRVSLHCKGCAGKLKKHISRMEGVTSFNIDFIAKKVTIVGDVTPLSVLASVSKVKNAQFWPVPEAVPEAAPSSPTATTAVVVPGNYPEMKK